jgi:hypothetical protein
MRRVRGRAALIASLLLISGCGVPAQDEPHPVTLPRRPLNETASAAAAELVGEVAQILCLTRDDRLVHAVRRSDALLSPQRLLNLLIAGPTAAEREQGMGTALATTSLSITVATAGRTAAVEISEPGEGTGRSDEALAYGQVVCTLTSRPDIVAVTFLRDGRPLQVPRGDGILTGDPLRAADYRSLMDPP